MAAEFSPSRLKPADESGRPQRIAVIGGGIAGLSASWMLGEKHRVTLIERLCEPGMGAHGIDLDVAAGTSRLDVPIRTFYEGYYPNLAELYRCLGVETEPVDFASTYASLAGEVYLRYRNLRFGSLSVPWVVAPYKRTARRIMTELWRFRRQTGAAFRRDALGDATLGDVLDDGGFGREMVDYVLLPLFAVICTCSYQDVRRFPATIFADYFRRGAFRQAMRRPVAGTPEVVRRLSGRVEEMRCGVAVGGLEERPGGIELRYEDGDSEIFDHVVVATQANQAQALIASVDAAAADVLSAFRYDWIRVVTHTDPALMPKDRRDWSPINAAICRNSDRPMATIWLDAAQPSLGLPQPIFQTVHPLIEPREHTVLGRADFERPLVDASSERALGKLAHLQSQPGRRLWLCGSYASQGIPLLESAVTSAAEIARRLG